MNRLILILILFFAGQNTAFGQFTWNFRDGKFAYVLNMDSVWSGKDKGWEIYADSISVFAMPDSELVQTIYPVKCPFSPYLDPEYAFVIQDVNFDGVSDIRMLRWIDDGFYRKYDYWICHKREKQFVEDSLLKDLMNPFFNQEEKFIHTYWTYGLIEYGHGIYRYNKGKLNTIVLEWEYWPPLENGRGYLVRNWFEKGEKVEDRIVLEEYVTPPHDECDLHESVEKFKKERQDRIEAEKQRILEEERLKQLEEEALEEEENQVSEKNSREDEEMPRMEK